MKILKIMLIVIGSFIFLCLISLYFYARIYLNAKEGFARDQPFINTRFINENHFTDFHKIWYGMDTQQVHRYIGRPKGYYTKKKYSGDRDDFAIAACYSEDANNDLFIYSWCQITLYYDSSNKLMEIRYNWIDGD